MPEYVKRGPYTKDEIEKAVKVMQQRAKAAGRGYRNIDGKRAAKELREQRYRDYFNAYTNYYSFNDRECKQFKSALSGKHGPINRIKKAIQP